MQRILRRLQSEHGQVLPMFVMLLVSFLALAGLAIDAGRVYVARAELTRALDAAALAGVIELPDVDAAANRATGYMDENQPDAVLSFPAADENQFRVEGTRNVDLLFMRIVGFTDLDITASAAAGFGIIPADTALVIDNTGSMGDPPCVDGGDPDEDTPGCPIYEAKTAASDFADFFLADSSGLTQVGFTPFRGCYNPPRSFSSCVPTSMVKDFTTNLTSIQSTIANVEATGGSGTNVCMGLWKALSMFSGPNAQTAPNTVNSLVLLTDGDNNYNSAANGSGSQALPTECKPSGSGSSASSCSGTDGAVHLDLDKKTRNIAIDTLESTYGVEIYVVAFGVCSSNSTTYTASQCRTTNNGGLIGSSQSDNTSDQRLLKCIASSTPGTNDHYFYVTQAQDLPQVFQDIANAIAFRLIE
jgi:hypothetical protein